MRKLIFIACIASVIFTPSCKKKDKPPQPKSTCSSPRIAYVKTSYDDSTVYTFSGEKISARARYDANKTLSDSTSYTYSGSTVTVRNYGGTVNLLSSSEITLGSNGLATKENRATIFQNGITYYDTVTYEYDINGYATQIVTKSGNSVVTTTKTIVSGNMTEQTVSSGMTVRSTYEYYTDMENKAGLNEYSGFQESYYGKTNKNLVKSITYPASGSVTSFTYVRDNDGYVTQVSNVGISMNWIYYKCQ